MKNGLGDTMHSKVVACTYYIQGYFRTDLGARREEDGQGVVLGIYLDCLGFPEKPLMKSMS